MLLSDQMGCRAVAAKKESGKDGESERIAPDPIMSIRVEKDIYERLRKLAFDKRVPMRDFIVRGVAEILKKEGY